MRLDFYRYIQEPWKNLWLFKLRSALALLGIVVGTASVVALISSGQFATQEALDQFKNLGTDLLAVAIEDSAVKPTGLEQKLSLAQVEQIKQSSPHILIAAPYTMNYLPISYNGQLISGSIIGATSSLSKIIKINLEYGRFVSELDGRQFFCVIGSEIAKKIIGSSTLNLLGKQIQLGPHYCTIVGVAAPWLENMFIYAEINHSVIMPVESSFSLGKTVRIQNIIFKLAPNADIDQTQQNITTTVHNLYPQAKLFSHSAKQLMDGLQKQRRTFTLMLGAIGGIALVVGGIGVMNIMLVAVIERRQEIGIRMALGATHGDIQTMFIIEAVVLSLLGGILGIVIGIFAAYIIALFSHWPFSIYLLPILIGFSVCMGVGIFSGYYPAYKAAQLDPIETLRCS